MRKYILTLAMLLLTANSWAGTSNLDIVNVSRTLTLTSPSATLTMNGVSATAFLRNVSVTGVLSATTVSTTQLNATRISSTQAVKAFAVVNGNVSPSVFIGTPFNFSSVAKLAGGKYLMTFTTPMNDANYAIFGATYLSSDRAAPCFGTSDGAVSGGVSPTTVAFRVNTFVCTTGGSADNIFYVMVVGN